MTEPVRAGADMRLLRAAVFAAVCVTLGGIGHTLASGDGVPPWALLAGWAAVLAVTVPLVGRERSLPGIATALLCGQLAVHVVFSAGQWCRQPAPDDRSGALLALAARLTCGDHPLRLTPAQAAGLLRRAGLDPATATAQQLAAAPHVAGGPPAAMHGAMDCSPAMLCGHLAAALAAGWLLSRGEAALWRLVRLSTQGARAMAVAAVLRPMREALAVAWTPAVIAGLLAQRAAAARRTGRCPDGGAALKPVAVDHSVARRGPPAVAFAA